MNPPEDLKPREWAIVALFAFMFIGISVLSLVRSNFDFKPPHASHPSEEITVKVTGAVARPGTYTVAKASALSLLLALSEPLPTALLTDKVRIRHQEKEAVLHVPSQEGIRVTFKGAVIREGEYLLPHNTRICDLGQYLECAENTDPRFMKRKRLLKDGESITIPYLERKQK